MPRVVVVTGSRGHPDRRLVERVLDRVLGRARPGDRFLHGGARDVDRWGGLLAAARGWEVTERRPDYARHPPHVAPLIRNGVLVAEAAALARRGYTALVVAFPAGAAHGTWHCVRAARAAGLPVQIYPIETEDDMHDGLQSDPE